MKDFQSTNFEFAAPQAGYKGLVALLVLVASVAWALWDFYAFSREQGSLAVELNIAMGWFVVLAFAYLGLHGLRKMAWASVTALLTLLAIAEFIVSPGWMLLNGLIQVDAIYVRAMTLILMGFIAFWVASLLVLRHNRIEYAPQTSSTSGRVSFMCLALFVVGFGTTFMLWRTGLFSYIARTDARESAISYMEWLVTLRSLLLSSLLVASIEKFGKRSTSGIVTLVFWLSLISSLGFGLISGMKSEVLMPLLILFLVQGITRKRFSKQIFILPVLLGLLYPINNVYRSVILSGYGAGSNNLSGLTTAVEVTVDQFINANAAPSQASDSNNYMVSSRLSALSFVHDVVSLPDPSLLNGAEKVWMAPFYPFIPRVLWKDKPVLDKGKRLSVALGMPPTTSTAVTPIGDLFMLGGTPGVIAGMFVYGLALQIFMNIVGKGEITERGLFFFLSVLPVIINIENDVVMLISASIQSIVLMLLVARLIYGPGIPFWRQPKVQGGTGR